MLADDDDQIICPADGKVVVIEEIVDVEFFKDKRIQVSIFMSPANVHVNRNPISGAVMYSKYHKGKYLVAWHPKSSTENERHSVVLQNEKGELLVKQIAGALAKRIVNYLSAGQYGRPGQRDGIYKIWQPGRCAAAIECQHTGAAKPNGKRRGDGIGDLVVG